MLLQRQQYALLIVLTCYPAIALERYLNRDPEMADAAIIKLEAYAKARAAAAAALQAVKEKSGNDKRADDKPPPSEAAG